MNLDACLSDYVSTLNQQSVVTLRQASMSFSEILVFLPSFVEWPKMYCGMQFCVCKIQAFILHT